MSSFRGGINMMMGGTTNAPRETLWMREALEMSLGVGCVDIVFAIV